MALLLQGRYIRKSPHIKGSVSLVMQRCTGTQSKNERELHQLVLRVMEELIGRRRWNMIQTCQRDWSVWVEGSVHRGTRRDEAAEASRSHVLCKACQGPLSLENLLNHNFRRWWSEMCILTSSHLYLKNTSILSHSLFDGILGQVRKWLWIY